MNDGGDVEDVEDAAVERAVQQLLTRDEARIISVVSLVITALGLVMTVCWFFYAWRTQRALSGGGQELSQFGGSDDPDIVDRIVQFVQDGFVLSLSVLVLTAGLGLRLVAGRLLAQRQQIDELDAPDDDVVREVTLEPEL